MKKLNRKVIQILNLFGDRFNKKREVTQWFYFENLTNLEKCELHLNKIGFKTQFKDLEIRKKFDKMLIVVSSKEAIDEDVFNLYFEKLTEIARIYNGQYDGWETSIENHQQLN